MDINKVGARDLVLIKGIGEGRAKKVIELRHKKGRINNIDELSAIKGFGEKTIKILKKYMK